MLQSEWKPGFGERALLCAVVLASFAAGAALASSVMLRYALAPPLPDDVAFALAIKSTISGPIAVAPPPADAAGGRADR